MHMKTTPLILAALSAAFTLGVLGADRADNAPGPVVKEYIARPPSLDGSKPAKLESRGLTLPAVWAGGDLAVPKDIHFDFDPARTNYVAVYSVTNKTDSPVQIKGYTSSCQCTSVESTSQTVPARGTIQIKAVIQQRQPTVQYVILQDGQTNLYQTVIWIQPKRS
jgi:Protein of unknown function (DUF1573)